MNLIICQVHNPIFKDIYEISCAFGLRLCKIHRVCFRSNIFLKRRQAPAVSRSRSARCASELPTRRRTDESPRDSAKFDEYVTRHDAFSNRNTADNDFDT